MNCKKKVFVLLLFSLLFSASAWAGIADSGELTDASFWIRHNAAGEQVILNENEIAQFNRKIYGAGLAVTDMKSLPSSVPVDEFLPWITNTWAMNGTVYRKEKELT